MKTKRGVVGALALACALVAMSTEGQAAVAPSERGAPELVRHSASSAAAKGSQRAWTPERMRAARPMRVSAPSEARRGGASRHVARTPAAAGSVAPALPEGRSSANGRAKATPKTTGKVFFTVDGSDWECSGSVINHPTGSVVLTAAQCLAADGLGVDGFFEDFAFVPRYENGNAPLGVWYYENAWAFDEWLDYGSYDYDYGMLQMQPDDAGNVLQQYTGGNGLKWNYPAQGRNITILGWDGETGRRCNGTARATFDYGGYDAAMKCKLGDGSAGGPWFRPLKTPNQGYVYAVTSRSPASGKKWLLAAQFGDGIAVMYDAVDEWVNG